MAALAKDSRLMYERVVIPRPEWKIGGINTAGVTNEVASGNNRFSDPIALDGKSATHLFCSLYTASSTALAVAFYDEEMIFIGGVYSVDNLATRDKAYPIEIPYNTAFVRFGTYNTVANNWFGEYYKGDVISAIERVKYATEWHNDSIRIMNGSPRNTSAVIGDAVKVDCAGAVSLRVVNTLDQPCKITLIDDSASTNTAEMLDASGNAMTFDAQAGYTTIITPEDCPALKYLYWAKVKAQCVTAPTTGNIRVYAYKKV